MKSFVPNDMHDVVRSMKYSLPFSVVNMEELRFFDIQTAADDLFNTKSLNISKAVHVRIDSKKLGNLLPKETFSDFEQWKETCILKKGNKASDLKNTMSDWRFRKNLNDEDLPASAEAAAFEIENLPLDSDIITDEEDSENEEGGIFEVEKTSMCLVDDVEEAVEEKLDEAVEEVVKAVKEEVEEALDTAVEDAELDFQPEPQNKEQVRQTSVG
ncbi:unnamed protein product [Psylliodes chrysocephalus]|uniref:Uncharacterized protein n=1 Tax=Psylliodes chrysocephalus TaxID=3402493 RepID=A0A9P0CZS4_9CUCU|nr:unnamed protein product [Psylliodes chrysocephala]